MEKIRAALRVSFGTKVLVPVVITMVLLLGITVWILNYRLKQQFQADAARSLAHADTAVRNSHALHTKNLLLRYHDLPDEPRYKALFLKSDVPTWRASLAELRGEKDLDVILYTPSDRLKQSASAKRDPLLSPAEFEVGSATVVHRALQGEEQADTIRVADRLFDVVSVPVRVGNQLIGALTLASEIGNTAAQELRDVAQCQIVLLANGRVIASTVGRPEWHEQLAALFSQGTRNSQGSRPRDIQLGDEHYFCSSGKFNSLSEDGKLGWLLLLSYEDSLRALQTTQQMLLVVSSLAILAGTGIVWFFIRRVTRPLRDLSASAEAVGQGDFSRRVEVTSGDECGELAAVFNQMTENLKRSREQLESTVETLKTTQAQLVQSEKLSGIGEFVAGVAHELNNPLTTVMGFSELLGRADGEPQHKRYLDMIHKSAMRCQKIVQSLLSFARRHQPERKLSSINELVENAVEFLQYQLRTSNIEVTTRLAADLPRTMLDPHQIQQVFLNILNNARQAIEGHQPKGSVRISTETCGNNVRISFQDNGPGIPEKDLSKVFDPFFTTKEVGKGTGLGLSLCYGIIKEHGGTINIRSKPGEGALFVLELPLVSSTQDAVPARKELPSVAASNVREGAGKKILVIDDEEAILEMVRETLSENGYEVDIARDGESALRHSRLTSYDLALCDWRMPGLNGQEVYEQLQVSNPALSERMIFITGDVINEKALAFLRDRHKVCLAKPFSLLEFRAAIGKAMAPNQPPVTLH